MLIFSEKHCPIFDLDSPMWKIGCYRIEDDRNYQVWVPEELTKQMETLAQTGKATTEDKTRLFSIMDERKVEWYTKSLEALRFKRINVRFIV